MESAVRGRYELLPPLSTEEFEALKADIERHGVRDSVSVDENGDILDGHHRAKIDPNAPRRVIKGLSESEKLAFVYRANFARRNLSPEQKSEQRRAMQEIAGQLREEGNKQADIAALLGVSRQTVGYWLNISDASIGKAYTPDCRIIVPKSEYQSIANRLESGESQQQIAADYGISQPRVSQIIRAVTPPEPASTPPIPVGKYRCIVIDPPWPMQKIDRALYPNQGQYLDYPVMSLDEIAVLPIGNLAHDNCHLYLWVTQKYLPDGLRIVEGWGFNYQCLMTWVKPSGFTPYSWMYNTEHVIFARRGNLPLERMGLKLAFDASTNGHSAKPPVFYDRVLEASPEPRLEMFARRHNNGFTVWGNEV